MPLPSLILPTIVQLIRQLLPAPDPAVIHLQRSHSLIDRSSNITFWGNHLFTSNEHPNIVRLRVELVGTGAFPQTFNTIFNVSNFAIEMSLNQIFLAAFPGAQWLNIVGQRYRIWIVETRNTDGIISDITSNTVDIIAGHDGVATQSPELESIIPQIPADAITPITPITSPDQPILTHVINRMLEGIPLNAISEYLKDFTEETRQSVINLINQGLLFLGRAEEIGKYLVNIKFGKIRRFETLAELQAELKNIPSGTVIAVKNGLLPFGRSGQQVLLQTTNPEPILLTIMGVIFSWKFIYAILTAMGLYVIYQVFRQPEASIIDETPETLTITTAGRVIVLNRNTGEIISDTGDPKTPVETITEDKLLLIGGGAIGGFLLASLLRR